jgi:hypothetical protein
MLNFCTLFDSLYLTRGVLMYQSLENVCEDFHLYIFAFDDISLDILRKMELKKATIISLNEFEDEKLLNIKSDRTKAEYCWTCTPSTILFVIEHFNVTACTYIDADLFFYQNPQIIFNEMGKSSILLTEHRYPTKFNRSEKSGRYCVQFITFLNDSNGLNALKWWRESCIEWCYDRYEEGKFGDQKYLDDWTSRFNGVHVLQHLGGGLASWNVEQWPLLSRIGNTVTFLDTKTNRQFQAIFYHFHHVRFYKGNLVDFGWRHPTLPVIKTLYVPYINGLYDIETYINTIVPGFHIPLQVLTGSNTSGWKNKVKYFIKKYVRYNVFDVRKLIKKYPENHGFG